MTHDCHSGFELTLLLANPRLTKSNKKQSRRTQRSNFCLTSYFGATSPRTNSQFVEIIISNGIICTPKASTSHTAGSGIDALNAYNVKWDNFLSLWISSAVQCGSVLRSTRLPRAHLRVRVCLCLWTGWAPSIFTLLLFLYTISNCFLSN